MSTWVNEKKELLSKLSLLQQENKSLKQRLHKLSCLYESARVFYNERERVWLETNVNDVVMFKDELQHSSSNAQSMSPNLCTGAEQNRKGSTSANSNSKPTTKLHGRSSQKLKSSRQLSLSNSVGKTRLVKVFQDVSNTSTTSSPMKRHYKQQRVSNQTTGPKRTKHRDNFTRNAAVHHHIAADTQEKNNKNPIPDYDEKLSDGNEFENNPIQSSRLKLLEPIRTSKQHDNYSDGRRSISNNVANIPSDATIYSRGQLETLNMAHNQAHPAVHDNTESSGLHINTENNSRQSSLRFYPKDWDDDVEVIAATQDTSQGLEEPVDTSFVEITNGNTGSKSALLGNNTAASYTSPGCRNMGLTVSAPIVLSQTSLCSDPASPCLLDDDDDDGYMQKRMRSEVNEATADKKQKRIRSYPDEALSTTNSCQFQSETVKRTTSDFPSGGTPNSKVYNETEGKSMEFGLPNVLEAHGTPTDQNRSKRDRKGICIRKRNGNTFVQEPRQGNKVTKNSRTTPLGQLSSTDAVPTKKQSILDKCREQKVETKIVTDDRETRVTCNECKQFYDELVNQGSMSKKAVEKLIQECSRHRKRNVAVGTPEGFWSIPDFPETQDSSLLDL